MSLRDKFQHGEFLLGAELVTTRGIAAQEAARKVIQFGEALAQRPAVDWISITDNAGGNPTLNAETLGALMQEKGAEVLIHLSAKDMNRNALEGRAWSLASRGLQNLLVLTGDYPVSGYHGIARPVFDVDSVCLLTMFNAMNKGLEAPGRKPGTSTILEKTDFFCGTVVSPFKQLEAELAGQYLKLDRKIQAGAEFIITQVGYDARKWHELQLYLAERETPVPLIGYVYLLNQGVARIFHKGMIPGCVVTDRLLEEIQKQKESPDRGKAFCREFAAKQVAILRGLGYKGAYLGGVVNIDQVDDILARADSFAPDDWRDFAKELQYPQHHEFFIYKQDPETGLADPAKKTTLSASSVFAASTDSDPDKEKPLSGRQASLGECMAHANGRIFHSLFFKPGSWSFRMGAKIYRFLDKHPFLNKIAYIMERVSKVTFFSCKKCADCSLPDIKFLCPESQCKKRQRNGPCGGGLQGKCEAGEKQCIWVRAYNRSKTKGDYCKLFERPVVFVDDGLCDSSSWANTYLGRDHNKYLLDELDEEKVNKEKNKE